MNKIINVFGTPVLVGNRCPKCKALIDDKTRYCRNCGRQVYK